MNIILFGPPGSGKGTLSSRLNEVGFFSISTGDILRQEVANKTDLGLKIADIMNRGDLVSDEIMINLIANQIEDKSKNYLLDGFPRNISQALELEKYFNVDKVVNLDVDKDVLFKRIIGRRVCQECKKNFNIYFYPPTKENRCDGCSSPIITRKDDNEASLSTRLEKYYEKSEKVIEYYQKQNKLFKIDGSKDPKEIFDTVKKKLNF